MEIFLQEPYFLQLIPEETRETYFIAKGAFFQQLIPSKYESPRFI
jgi:hypothetical protein